MVFVKPRLEQFRNFFATAAAAFDYNNYTQLEKNKKLIASKVNYVSIPKFHLQTKMNFNEILQSLGIKAAFSSGAADFSAIARNAKFHISRIVHSAVIVVDEEGTEAAAACNVVCDGMSSNPHIFELNCPFIFYIKTKDDMILFIGRVLNL
ncbi:serine protease inhibitor serpin-1-like protein [Leptotrombidium deliense]|uniref:Serine protease inhibitor serpin-1-like protein n=1 Tax=Leptotrombidium deliense TaxID=299467 RepID=A0A443R3X3_9ACAR|nr:serine protease inhibitor serpin-1-like protein [Leptotrombidium deliense]